MLRAELQPRQLRILSIGQQDSGKLVHNELKMPHPKLNVAGSLSDWFDEQGMHKTSKLSSDTYDGLPAHECFRLGR